MTMDPQELAQRRREADLPFWVKLRWIAQTSRLVRRLQAASRVEPPAWARSDQRVTTSPAVSAAPAAPILSAPPPR